MKKSWTRKAAVRLGAVLLALVGCAGIKVSAAESPGLYHQESPCHESVGYYVPQGTQGLPFAGLCSDFGGATRYVAKRRDGQSTLCKIYLPNRNGEAYLGKTTAQDHDFHVAITTDKGCEVSDPVHFQKVRVEID